jgi:GntR family transcriptional regulator
VATRSPPVGTTAVAHIDRGKHGAMMVAETSPAQLLEQLRDVIAQDGLLAGDRMPSETALAIRFGVSRTKVREVLKLLEREGLVHAVQGSGRFVSPLGALRVERPITVYEGISEMLSGRGHEAATLVLNVEETNCDQHVAEALGIAVDDPIIRLVRLRLVDDEPVVLSINAVPRMRLPGPLEFRDWSGSLTAALEAHGNRIVSSAAQVSARNLDRAYADRYNLTGFDPWLVVEESCITRTGDRVMHAIDYHRADVIGFSVLRQR